MCNTCTSNALYALVLSKKRVLSNWNCSQYGSRSSSHMHFQAARSATEKARRPYVERLCRGTSSWRRLAERRWRREATSEIGVQKSVTYEWALPWRHETAMGPVSDINSDWLIAFRLYTRSIFIHLPGLLIILHMFILYNLVYRFSFNI